ncbi:MAG: CehA/McbA family metallohydrolase [Cyclobacteriaceae bacterium]
MSESFLPVTDKLEPQPILAQAIRICQALTAIGNPLPSEVQRELLSLKNQSFTARTTNEIQKLLDPYCLFGVEINPEARVKVVEGSATPELIKGGWRSYLVKIYNQAAVTAPLVVNSPNSKPTLFRSSFEPQVKDENVLSPGQVEDRFLELLMYGKRPMKSKLSGLKLEYAIVQIYTKSTGHKEAKIGFNIGPGTQDIGFRNTVDILFNIKPSVKTILKVHDSNGPTIGSFIFMDGIERVHVEDNDDPIPNDYRLTKARMQSWEEPGFDSGSNWPSVMFGKPAFPYDSVISKESKLIGIYPLPSRRVALTDEYPDFFFQPQIYRANGEHLFLPPGNYSVYYGRGPEYLKKVRKVEIPYGVDSLELNFELERWIDMSSLGWYSGDHHIHAAGCSHYESPAEGVRPEDMWRQVQGEDLNIGLNLAWGPCWYYQKEFFTGQVHPLSDNKNLLRYDVEISGFPSSHAGHLVLLNLKEDDYPNTSQIEDWPSWTLPILQWAQKQGGVVGYAHSGIGLEPFEETIDLPNYNTPKMDGIGANEYIMTVAHNAVDIFSLGNTPSVWELNMWYHTLNAGFKTRISGETDFPCVTDERVGRSRVYAKMKDSLNFDTFIEAIKTGRSYVSDGFSHLIDFNIDGTNVGENRSELNVSTGDNLNISVRAAAMLDNEQGEIGKIIQTRNFYEGPFWHVEKARIGNSRKIPVELIVNGVAVDKQELEADGNWNLLDFNYTITESSWVALRVLPSSHTNPIFVYMDDTPIVKKESVEWCIDALNKCWEEKSKAIRESEIDAAKQAYEYARNVYNQLLPK